MNNIDRDFAVKHSFKKKLLELNAREAVNAFRLNKSPYERLKILKGLKKDIQKRALEILKLEG